MLVALDIGSTTIKGIKVKSRVKNTSDIEIEKYFYKKFDSKVTQNGYIVNREKFSSILKDLIKEYNLSKSKCIVTLNSKDIITLEIDVPIVKKKYLKDIIYSKIEGLFDIKENYFIDYVLAEQVIIEGKTNNKFIVYAVPKKLVFEYYNVLKDVGLKPKRLDLQRNVLSKLISCNSKINDKTINDKSIIFLDIGSSILNLSLILNQQIVYNKVIDIRLPEKEEFSVDDIFSDFILNNTTLNNDSSKINKNKNVVHSSILKKINEELFRMSQFSATFKNAKTIENIYLYGGNISLKEIGQNIEKNLGIPVENIEKVSNIKHKDDVDVTDLLTLVGSIIKL